MAFFELNTLYAVGPGCEIEGPECSDCALLSTQAAECHWSGVRQVSKPFVLVLVHKCPA